MKEAYSTLTKKLRAAETRIRKLELAESKRRKAEAALRKSEQRYRAVVEDQTELISPIAGTSANPGGS